MSANDDYGHAEYCRSFRAVYKWVSDQVLTTESPEEHGGILKSNQAVLASEVQQSCLGLTQQKQTGITVQIPLCPQCSLWLEHSSLEHADLEFFDLRIQRRGFQRSNQRGASLHGVNDLVNPEPGGAV